MGFFHYRAELSCKVSDGVRKYTVTGFWGLVEDVSVTRNSLDQAKKDFKLVQAREPDSFINVKGE